MAGPWEQYQSSATPEGPWTKFAAKPAAPTLDPLADPLKQVIGEMPEAEKALVGVGSSLSSIPEGIKQLAAHAAEATPISDAVTAVSPIAKIAKIALGPSGRADAAAADKARAMEALKASSPSAGRAELATDIATGLALPGARAVPTKKAIEEAAKQGATALPGLLDKIIAGGKTGFGYGLSQPTAGQGDFGTEKAKQGGAGAVTGATLSGILNGLPSGIKALYSRMTGGKSVAPETGPAGAGAEKVTDELQRVRSALESGKIPAGQPRGASTPESLLAEKGEITARLPQIFQEAKPVDVSNAFVALDQAERKSITPQMNAALKEARTIIKNAIQKSGATGAAARAIESGSISKADYRALLQGKAGSQKVNLEMADEIRQALQLEIDKVGDKALPANAKSILSNVRDAITSSARKASSDYGKYLDDFGRTAEALGKYAPAETVLGKVTSGSKEFQRLTGMDAQKSINSALSGKRAARDLQELVDLTAHSPEARQGLRQSYKDWLIQMDALGEIETGKMLTRWRDMKDATQKSGLFDAEHFKNLDDTMNKLRSAYSEGDVKKWAGNAIGWLVGGGYKGSYFGRNIGAGMSRQIERDLERQIVEIASHPEGAKLLAQPQTPENVAKMQSFRLANGIDWKPEVANAVATIGAREAADGATTKPRRRVEALQGMGAGR